MPSLTWIIARHAWHHQWRSKTPRLLLALNLLLVLVVGAVHWHQQQAFAATQQHWQAVNNELWQTQPDRHPHRVAHYGSLAFRSQSPLSFLDAGINPTTGNLLFLEAHRQNSSGLRQFLVSPREMGLGYPSVATLVLVFWPLVLCALAHGAISDERASGNLNLLASLGVRSRHLLLGHGLVFTALSASYLLCLGLIAGGFIATSPQAGDLDTWRALVWCLLLYLGYCLVWITAILLLSAASANSARTLMLCLCLWLAWVVVIPRSLNTIAEIRHPAPAKAAFDIEMEKAIARIGDAHDANDPYFRHFREQTLARHGVDRVEDLPMNWRGLVMQEGERISKEVFDQHYQQLTATYQRQNNWSGALGILSPYAVIARLSAQLSGSTADDYQQFERQAEAFRYAMVSELNNLQTEKLTYATDKQTRLDQQHWQQFAQFTHRPDQRGFSVRDSLSLLLSLALWACIALLIHRRLRTPS